MTKIAGSGSESGSISQRQGSADPDPHQNVMDPEHYRNLYSFTDLLADIIPGQADEVENDVHVPLVVCRILLS